MKMICIFCGKETKYTMDTTALCDECKTIYEGRREINEDAVHNRERVQKIQRTTR